MATINLEAKNTQEKAIKVYLEKNASDELANKINNGTSKVIKEGEAEKVVINRKDFAGCMKYITEEARKKATGNVAVVEDKVVYGWAVHYFEEESIEGTLYNEDGTEYKNPSKGRAQKANTKPEEDDGEEIGEEDENRPVNKNDKPKKPESPQINFFDLLG